MKAPHLSGDPRHLSLEAERDFAGAQRAELKALRRRRVQVDSKTYTPFDAHALLEANSETLRARPGHPFGA